MARSSTLAIGWSTLRTRSLLARYVVTPGSHTVVFTVTSSTSASNVNSVTWLGGPFPLTQSTPRVYVGGLIYEQNDEDSAETTTYNTILSNLTGTLISDGLPVDFVNVRNWVNSSTDMSAGPPLPPLLPMSSCADSTARLYHGNNCGHWHIAEVFEYHHGIDYTTPLIFTPTQATH